MFKSELCVTHLILTNSLRLKEPLIFKDDNELIKVPKGFIYDGASTPFFLRNLFPKMGARYDRASCLHDFLYTTKLKSRKECDKLFYKAMICDGVPKIKAYAMFKAVRIFGGFRWNKVKDAESLKIRELLNEEN